MSVREIAKVILPKSVRDYIRRVRFRPAIRYIYRQELLQIIRDNPMLGEANVRAVMKKHGYKNLWFGVFTLHSGIPSTDYVPEDFFHIHIASRMNNVDLMTAYEDKNIYDLLPLKQYTIEAVARKIGGRFFDKDYNPATPERIKKIMEGTDGDLVIKPAIDSGSGKNVWVGPAHQAFGQFMRLNNIKDIIVQKRIRGDAFSQSINADSLNTIRCMTAYTGHEYAVLGCMYRVGRAHAYVDNQNAGGMALGVRENGEMFEAAMDRAQNRFLSHPDSGFVFKGQVVPAFQDIKKVCLECHRFLPHFGLVSWDVARDHTGAIKIVEVNLNWQGNDFFQYYLGPLFGPYKDQIKKTYDLPDWEEK